MGDSVSNKPFEHPITKQFALCPTANMLVGQSVQAYEYDGDPLSEP